MTRRRRTILVSTLVVVALFAILTERWFVHPRVDEPGTADAIFVLDGGGDRREFAVDLVRDNVSLIAIFASPFIDEQGVWASGPCNSSRPAGVPDDAVFECFEPEPDTTRGEVRRIADIAEQRGYDEIVVVASTDQITRARLLLGRCWHGEARFTGPDHNRPWPVRAAYEWGAMVKAQLLRGC